MHESALLADAMRSPPVVRIGHHDGLAVLVLDPDAPFEVLRQEVRELLGDAEGPGTALKGQGLRLDFGSRELALLDLRRLVSLLRDEFEITVSGVCCTQRALQRYAEQELKLRVLLREPQEAPGSGTELSPLRLVEPEPASAEPASAEPAEDPHVTSDASIEAPSGGSADAVAEAAPAVDAEAEAGPTKDDAGSSFVAAAEPVADVDGDPTEIELHDDGIAIPQGRRVLALGRTLRSGARIRFPGDVVVYGDVNAGAQIEADGNIVVLGSLRGLAHAGARGDEEAVIISFDLRPTQVRIGRRIAFPPEQKASAGGKLLSLLQRDRAPGRSFSPEIAHVQDGTIVLEDYRGRLPVSGRKVENAHE